MNDVPKFFLTNKDGAPLLHICRKAVHKASKESKPYTIVDGRDFCLYVWRNVPIENGDQFYITKINWIQPFTTEFNGKAYNKLAMSCEIKLQKETLSNDTDTLPADTAFADDADDTDLPF